MASEQTGFDRAELRQVYGALKRMDDSAKDEAKRQSGSIAEYAQNQISSAARAERLLRFYGGLTSLDRLNGQTFLSGLGLILQAEKVQEDISYIQLCVKSSRILSQSGQQHLLRY